MIAEASSKSVSCWIFAYSHFTFDKTFFKKMPGKIDNNVRKHTKHELNETHKENVYYIYAIYREDIRGRYATVKGGDLYHPSRK